MITYIFPGQGSQQKGMSSNLFSKFPDFVSIADDILGYSIEDLCVNDPNNLLSKTQYTQPALYTVNVLNYLDCQTKGNAAASYLAGHSLGEYNALYAAEVYDFETGLRLVQKRGQLMSEAKEGGMAAVIGMDEQAVQNTLNSAQAPHVDIANLNSPGQIVISGPRSEIERLQTPFEQAECMTYIVLKVSGAFHSHLMKDARKQFEIFLEDFTFSDPKTAVISNVTARPYEPGKVKQLLADQITHSVKWTESIRYLWGKGCDTFEELGPGNTLTNLIKKIKKEAQPLLVDQENDHAKTQPFETTPAASNGIYSDHKNKESELSEPTQPSQNGSDVAGTLSTHIKSNPSTRAAALGSEYYKKAYGVQFAYASGGMYKAISSTQLVIKMARAGFMSYYGTGGVGFDTIEEAIQDIQQALGKQTPFGMNIIHDLNHPQNESKLIDLYLRYGILNIEASAFMQVTAPLVKFRLKGLRQLPNGEIVGAHRIQAKLSRPEIAQMFLAPPPQRILDKLLEQGEITPKEAEWGTSIPVATDICVEADSGGHTDQGIATVLVPTIHRMRDKAIIDHQYKEHINLGAAGGIGTPESAASAFILGAEYIVTGSINQCTVEAGISDQVKDMLETMNVQDTTYAPAGDMFELGAKIQVFKKGVFFPARANKLYDIYKHHESLEQLDLSVRSQLEQKYFKRTFEDIYEDCKGLLSC